MSEQESRIKALEDEVKDLKEQLRETLKLLYRHEHSGMVGSAYFPEDLGGMEDRMVRSYAESQGALLSRVAAVTDDENDGE